MKKADRIKQLLINHTYQVNQYDDCSGVGRVRPATKREILRAYKRIGKPPPPDLVPQLKLIKNKKTG